MKRERVTEFWLVDGDGESWSIGTNRRGDLVFSVGESPCEDCDFDGLTGIVALEGDRCIRERDDQTEDEGAPNYWPHGSWEWFYPNPTWRQATTEEAAALGFIGAPKEADNGE